MQKVIFLSDGLSIHGTFVMPPSSKKPCPGVIIFHGMTSSENGYIPLAESLAEHGIAGLAVTMRGHGKSEGNFDKATVGEAINDGLAAYDFLVSQPGIDANKIGFLGSSVGAILTAITSSQRSVRSIVFRVPAAYTADMMQISMAETMINEGKQFHEIKDLKTTPAGEAISNFRGSLLIVASENDDIIPLSIPEAYLNAAQYSDKKRLFVIKGATHTLTDPQWKETLRLTVVDWFIETLL